MYPQKTSNLLEMRYQIKEIDRYALKAPWSGYIITDWCTWETVRKLSVRLFLFDMLNKYGLADFITSVSDSLSAENSMYNQHHNHRICACMNFYFTSIIWRNVFGCYL